MAITFKPKKPPFGILPQFGQWLNFVISKFLLGLRYETYQLFFGVARRNSSGIHPQFLADTLQIATDWPIAIHPFRSASCRPAQAGCLRYPSIAPSFLLDSHGGCHENWRGAHLCDF